MAEKQENHEAFVLEEWNASASKLVKTAVLITDNSGRFSVHREISRMSEVWRKFTAAFLPEGFPNSVTPDYMPFQIWDSLQGLSTYIRCMLSTQALLSAIGVGETAATVIGATFQWFLRDFSGMLGGILFTLYQGSNLDSKAKMWRLIADLMNDLGMLMDLISPLYPTTFVIILCLGSIARSFTGVASGATRAALTQHFALQQNAADISAKEGSQETMATMVGMLLGMLLSHITADRPGIMWSSFLILTFFHMFANYQAVRCLCLTSLNEERAKILLQNFMTNGQVLTPKEVSSMEHLLPNWISLQRLRKDSLFHTSVKLGAKVSSLQQSDMLKLFSSSTHYRKGQYLLLHKDGTIHIILHKHAVSADILESYIHALVLSSYMGSSTSVSNIKSADSCSWMEKYYSVFISKLQASGWKTERLLVPSTDWRAQWGKNIIDDKAI
eukprot:Gb_26344 [translate_table: standard]